MANRLQQLKAVRNLAALFHEFQGGLGRVGQIPPHIATMAGNAVWVNSNYKQNGAMLTILQNNLTGLGIKTKPTAPAPKPHAPLKPAMEQQIPGRASMPPARSVQAGRIPGDAGFTRVWDTDLRY